MIKKFILLFSVILLASCSDDDDAGQPVVEEFTTFETIANSPDHEMLEQALMDTGLDQVLNSGTYTVFAPTDAAFGNIDVSGLSTDDLKNVLLNHVITGAAMSTDLTNGYIDTNAKNSDDDIINMHVSTDGGVTLNGMSSVITADVTASNGVVHIVDEVITIPSVATFATADNNFTGLVAALTRESSFTFVDVLSSTDVPAPFTVFAPTNAAFSDFLDELGLSSLGDVPTSALEATLNSHVIAGANVRSEDLTDGTVNTLGDPIEIDAENAVITDQNGRMINITVTDVQAGNGVIHVIDKVIAPDNVIETTYEIISESPDHTVLAQALMDADLVSALNSDEFTVFAPTDAAFGNIDISGLSAEEVKNVLMNHVVAGTNMSADLSNMYVNTLATETISGDANNLSLYINIDSGVMLNGMSTVTVADLEATNGVVHVVDEVITIPDVTTFATADPNFSILVDALTRESSFTYVNTLSSFDSPAPFTVFAPTNDAFVDVLGELNFASLNDIPTATLEATLNTHVVAGAYVTSNTISSGVVQTLGDDITLDAAGGTIEDPNGRTSTIVKFDVQAGNGVIHAIDTVLLPEL